MAASLSLPMSPPRRSPAALLALSAAALALAGCAFSLPGTAPPVTVDGGVPDRFHAADLAPALDSPTDLAAWWRRFDDPVLSALMDEAMSDSLDLQAAESRVREARAALRQSESARWLSVTGGASAGARSTTRFSQTQSSDGTGSVEGGIDASWEADLFGRVSRSVDASAARALGAEARLGATLVALNGDLAEAYLSLRGLQRRLALADESLALQRQTRTLVREQAAAGLVTTLDVERADAAVFRLEAQRPGLEAGIAQTINRLSILVGQPPGALAERLSNPAPVPHTAALPSPGVPADLLRRRPDLRAAELDVLAAAADRDVAVADLAPRLTLPGALTLSATGLGTATVVETMVATLGASLSIPLFDGGRRQAAVEASEERIEQALIAYRGSLLAALNDVEDALIDRAEATQRRDALQRTVGASERAVALSSNLYEQGLSSFLDVLDAQRELASARQSLAEAEVDLGRADVRLFKALGGGWS